MGVAMTTYTITQEQMDALEWHTDPHSILRSLKPNSQDPVGYYAIDSDGNYGLNVKENFAMRECNVGATSSPVFTHPAPMSKGDAVKVLKALESNRIMAQDEHGNYTREITPNIVKEAVTIIQRITGEVK
jgi:hypothetical protein